MERSARRKKSDKRRSTDDDLLLLEATDILACMLGVGGGNELQLKNDHSIDVMDDAVILRRDGILARNKFSLAADVYVRTRQALSKGHRSKSEQFESELQELEEASFHLQTVSEDLVLVGERERELLCHRLMKRIRTLLRNGGEFRPFVAQAIMFARFLVQQHYRQIKFEIIAHCKVVELVMSQYDNHFPEQNSPTETQLNLQELNKLKYYADGVRLRVHLDRLEWKKIAHFVKKGSSNNDTQSCSTDTSFDADDNIYLPSNTVTKTIIMISDKISTIVGSSKSPEEAIHSFLHFNAGQLEQGNQNALVLLCGEKGSGKTHFCDEITRIYTSCSKEIAVLRPEMPVDMLRNTVGSAIDVLLSLLASAKEISVTKKCILILENIDILLGGVSTELESLSDGGKVEQLSTLSISLQSTFASVLRSLREARGEDNGILLFCTSAEKIPGFSDWFDAIFTLERPANQQRHDIIVSCLNLRALDNDLSPVLSRLVSCTAGRSVAEISSFCRTAVSECFEEKMQNSERDVDERKLSLLEDLLRGANSEVMSSGFLTGVVDVEVEGSKELLSFVSNNARSDGEKTSHPQLTLFGDQARSAWERLENMIIHPLCRSAELEELLYGKDSRCSGRHESKVVCAGALLVGSTGTGKSTLARHCAAVAASINPSIKLLTVSCTSLVHKEVGASERALKHLFRAAKSSAPCVLLLEGIENIAPVRGNDNTSEGTMDRLVSTLLIEIDGIDDGSVQNHGRVAIIGTTHNAEWIDPALKRPGRLDNFIELSVPDDNTRSKIAMHEIQKRPFEFSDESYRQKLADYISTQSNGWSAADVMALCGDAAFARLRELVVVMDQSPSTDSATYEPVVQQRNFISAMKLRKQCSL